MSCDIDDSLYSRQRCVLGENAMKRMCKSKVFLHGLGGVGIEIDSKSASVNSVTFFSVYLLQTFRAEASLDRLTALNPYVRITLETGDVTDIRCPLSEPANKNILKPLVDEGSSTKVDFIYTDIYGTFGNLFCDFGSDFTVLTQDDEPCREFFIGKIEKINDEELLITVLGDRRHHLENNDVIRFTELKNLPVLNEREFPIRVKSPSELIIKTSIKDIQFPYSDGGIVLQVKKPQVYTFETMLEQLKSPKLMCVDFSEPEPIKIDESLVKRLAFASQGQLAPLSAVFGGIAAQEAMKAITFTFTPINQWLYIHCASIVPLEVNTQSNEFQNTSIFVQGCTKYICSSQISLVICVYCDTDRLTMPK
ncbi:unnamed protein product [Schistosoma curassoni]|uniref:E1_FCCH domain-containing protein n=1 Tax=Schistosoma curassoni TaxID=6186 RepID=A0A183K9W2_9TREM|nr:unnamed protein product [Schistosoma curassoni]